MAHAIFISCSSKDKSVAEIICANLEGAGLRCWIAPRDIAPGEDWPAAITNAISNSRAMVLVFSTHSNASPEVSRELYLAGNAKVVIIPFKIENVKPEPGKEYYLGRTHWLEAMNPPTQAQLNQLIERVKFASQADVSNSFQSAALARGVEPPAPILAEGQPGPEIFHNLPSRNELIGRKDEKTMGHQALLSRSHIISIDGIGGVGKTALALEIAHECLKASKGDQLADRVATFKGFIWTIAKDQGSALDNLLDEIVRTLGHAGVMRWPLEEKRNWVIRLLQDRSCLLIMDSFESITDNTVRDFLFDKIPEPSKVMITTREQISQAWSISLNGLSEPEALDLIRSHGRSLGLKAVERAKDSVLMQLCRATGGLPLAIKWALGQIKQKGQSLTTVLRFLYKAQGDIFDHMFLRSWTLLTPAARRILRIMPIFGGDTFQLAIEAASRVSGPAFDRALGQLVTMSFVNTTFTPTPSPAMTREGQLEEMSLVNTPDNPDLDCPRYSVHPLTRFFAGKKLNTKSKIAQNANKRLASFFEVYTREHGGLWNLKGFEKLKPDISNLTAVIQWCWREHFIELGINIFDNLRYFFVNSGLWNTAMGLAQEAIQLVALENEKLPEPLAEWQTKAVRFRIWPLAWIQRCRGHFDVARDEINQALKIFEQSGDKNNAAYTKRHLGLIFQDLGDMENAERLLREALEFSCSIQDQYRTQLLTADLAVLALKQGNLDKAWQMSRIVLDPLHQITDRQCIATFHRVLGSVERQRGNLERAQALCEKALAYIEQLEYRDGIAEALFELAQVEIKMEQTQSAHQKYERARGIYHALGVEHKVQEIENAIIKFLEPENANQSR